MSWPLTKLERDLFIQFLEPNPPLNNHGNLKIRAFSFYSSELKSLGQVLRTLLAIDNGLHQSGAITDVRYRNTLLNMGLISKKEDVHVSSQLGIQIIQYCIQSNIDISTFNDASNRMAAYEIEAQILAYLLSELIIGDPNEICTLAFKQILFNAQEVYKIIPKQELQNILDSEDKNYFLQLINSTGDEIKRYFRLTPQDRDQAERFWRDCADDTEFPANTPTEIIDSMVYKYCRTRALSTLQYDIRFRVNSFINAYHNSVLKFSEIMPLLNLDLIDINSKNIKKLNQMEERNFELGQVSISTPINSPRQRIVSGCPGSGKSFMIDDQAQGIANNFIIRTTFHQETSYFDFIGTYKPTPLYEKNSEIVNANGTSFQLGKPVINYSYVYGHLIEAYLMAFKNPDWNIILIIDEINRGNVGVIFGDFLQLLDRDYQKNYESKYSILPNADLHDFLRNFDFMREYLEVNGGHIRLPGNLFIWGTMNSADQGVFPIDSAFRRRWEFEYMGYNEPCSYGGDLLTYNNTHISWDSFRNQINKKLLTELNIPEDKLIGPYFLTKEEVGISNKILNKLFLYLWDDVARFQQKELMNFDSFSELKATWNNGQGKIFNFEIA